MKLFLALIFTMNLFDSCVNSRKGFVIYQEKAHKNGTSKVSLNGIFFFRSVTENAPLASFYLYQDGSIFLDINTWMINNESSRFWLNPEEYLERVKKGPLEDNVGHYQIINDRIHIQFFHRNDSYWVKRNTIDIYGLIRTDSTILLYQENCNWCGDFFLKYENRSQIIYDPPIEYHFYQTKSKPDSTVMWFKKKKWYQRKVWNQK